MIDGDHDIMFTIKVFEMKFCMDVYGVRLHCRLTIFEPGYCKKHLSYSRSYNLRQMD